MEDQITAEDQQADQATQTQPDPGPPAAEQTAHAAQPSQDADAPEADAPEAGEALHAPAAEPGADGPGEDGATGDGEQDPSAEAPGPEPSALDATMPEDKILEPPKLRFFRAEDGLTRLEIEGDRCYLEVRAARLYPISLRRELISIMDGAGDEIGVLRSVRSLPKPMRRIVLEELRKRYFVPQITHVYSLKDEFGILYWDAQTSRGRREFVVRDARDNVREFAGGRLQITDVDGNVFEVPDIDGLTGRGVADLYRLL